MDVLRRFRRILHGVRQHHQGVEKRCGVSGAQLWALHELALQPALKVTELAARLGIHQSTASNLVDRLDALGYVARRREVQDRRVVRISLTPKGTDTLARAPASPRGILREALERLPPQQLAALAEHLDALLRGMEVSGDMAPMLGGSD